MKEKYNELKTKYALPEREELSKDFDIEGIDDDDNILKEVIRKIFSKIDSYAGILENMMQPESLSSMQEASTLNAKDKTKIKTAYMKSRYITRMLVESGLDFSEEQGANAINEAINEWNKIKPDIKLIIRKLKNSWNGENKVTNDEGYFG